MSDLLSAVDGNTWEASVKRWLQLKHPNEFQAVPATDRGDGGIEGYCIETHSVYQCYAPLASLDTKSLYEAQRDKLTEDIGKFINNQAKFLKTLPRGFKVRRYCFVVPEMRSRELVAHANAKAAKVIAAKLPYVDDDFAVLVHDRQFFAPQIAEEQAKLLVKLNLDMEDPTPEEVQDWAAEHNAGVQNLDRKIRLYTSLRRPRDVRRMREHWIEAKIRSDNALELLREKSEDLWEKLWGVKRARERLLTREFGVAPGEGRRVQSISDQLARDMIGRVPNLEPVDADTLAEGLVGEWLQNCKLDFPGDEENDEAAA